jgi:hypothetical protein
VKTAAEFTSATRDAEYNLVTGDFAVIIGYIDCISLMFSQELLTWEKVIFQAVSAGTIKS